MVRYNTFDIRAGYSCWILDHVLTPGTNPTRSQAHSLLVSQTTIFKMFISLSICRHNHILLHSWFVLRLSVIWKVHSSNIEVWSKTKYLWYPSNRYHKYCLDTELVLLASQKLIWFVHVHFLDSLWYTSTVAYIYFYYVYSNFGRGGLGS